MGHHFKVWTDDEMAERAHIVAWFAGQVLPDRSNFEEMADNAFTTLQEQGLPCNSVWDDVELALDNAAL